MKKGIIFIFLMILGIILVPPSYSQNINEQRETEIARGQISQIDWTISTITVRYLQTEGYVSYDEITLFIPNSARIIRGTSTVGLAELQIGNQVTVEYINTSPGPLKVVNMTVLIP